MELAELKSEFHNLIEKANDPVLIEQFYKAMSHSINDGAIWHSLTPIQQEEVLEAYHESEDESNLISIDEIKMKYDKWS